MNPPPELTLCNVEVARAKREFLANMSHELRTPLNAIIGFSELLYDGRVGELDEVHRQYLGYILSSSRQLLQLINDILDLSRVENGQMVFAFEKVDLEQLARGVRDTLCPSACRKHLEVTIDVDPSVARVTGDAVRLRQVIYNYLSNAIKFTPDGGQVQIRIEPHDGDTFRIAVADSGIGVRQDDLSRLFVDFEQLDFSTAKLHQGVGLGLALTRRIVEAQGGTVAVHSTPGRGSTFSAILPRGMPSPE